MTPPRKRDTLCARKLSRGVAFNQLRLSTTQFTKSVFEYALAYSASKNEIEIHAYIVLPDQYRIVASPKNEDSDISSFMGDLNKAVSIAFKQKFGYLESFWQSKSFAEKPLETAEQVIDAIAQVNCLPVQYGLVCTPHEWPGPRTDHRRIARYKKVLDRPSCLGKRTVLPKEVQLSLTKPAQVQYMSRKKFRAKVFRRIKSVLREIRRKRLLNNSPKFLGRARCMELSRELKLIDYLPPKSIIQLDKSKTIQKAEADQETSFRNFQSAYNKALEKWKTDKSTIFPIGTYKLKVLYKVQCYQFQCDHEKPN